MIDIVIDKICMLLFTLEGVQLKIPIWDAVIIIFALAVVYFIKMYVIKLLA